MRIDRRTYKRIGLCLAEFRTSRSLTQTDLAKTLRKPQSFVSDYERGERRIDLAEFIVIARGIGIDPQVAFKGVEGAYSLKATRKAPSNDRGS